MTAKADTRFQGNQQSGLGGAGQGGDNKDEKDKKVLSSRFDSSDTSVLVI